jgi:hypothetical protein
MKIYNTVVPVIANVMAADEQDAVSRLTAALDSAGFTPYEWDSLDAAPQSFEAEQGTAESGIPLPGGRL